MKKAIIIISVLATALIPSAYASTASEREYKRGYNDYLQGRYDQDQHGESYKKGWDSAENSQKSHPAEAKKAPAKTKPAGKAKISDLVGISSIKAFDVMTSRGFMGVDTISMENTQYGIYYNAKTHQCVQLTNADNRVLNANEIDSHPKCK